LEAARALLELLVLLLLPGLVDFGFAELAAAAELVACAVLAGLADFNRVTVLVLTTFNGAVVGVASPLVMKLVRAVSAVEEGSSVSARAAPSAG
jgi:hypothetical protein